MKTETYSFLAATTDVRLNLNESPFAPEQIIDLPPIDWSELQLNRYLRQEEGPLLPALANYTNYECSNIVIGNGGDELILNLVQALATVSNNVLVNPPTFGVYGSAAEMCGKTLIQVPLLANFQLNTAEVLSSANEKNVDLIFICRPNNPTGNIFPAQDILTVLNNTNAYIVVDEAYFEFAETSMIAYLAQYPRLIILRTLSKAFAAAGLRIGYAIANPKVRDLIRQVQLPFNISNIAQLIGSVLLRNNQQFLQYVKKCQAYRDQLYSQLINLNGVDVQKSVTNFMLVKLPSSPDPIIKSLAEHGIAVRKIDHVHESLKNMIRISVGTVEQNQLLVDVLMRILGS